MRRPGIVVPSGAPSDVKLMLSWRPGAVTCDYNHLRPNQVFEYKAQNPGVSVIVRFQHPQNWFQNPEASAIQFGQAIAAKWNELRPLAPYVIFANALNTHRQNGDPDPQNQPLYETEQFYKRAGQWITRTAQVVKQLAPDMKLVTPPYAAGRGEDGAPDINGNITKTYAGYDYLASAIQTYFDNTLAFHAYWGDIRGSDKAKLRDPLISSWNAFRWRRLLALCKTRYNIEARIVIDEAGNYAAYDADFFEQITYFSQQTLQDPRVLALTYYIWEDPAFDPVNIFNVWTQYILGLPGFTRQLAVQPDVPLSKTTTPATPADSQISAPPPIPTDFTDSDFDGPAIRVMFDDGHVETMPLETYLRGVVPGEMPEEWPMEALKAQAVAARTYAASQMRYARYGNRAYDIRTDPSTHQNYRRDKIHPRTDAAILSSKALVVEHSSQPIQALFSANCGGHTRNSEDVFKKKDGSLSNPTPYLRGVACPAPGPKNGHGVGMCQHGAKVFAQQGLTFEQILAHYYTGVVIAPLRLDQSASPRAAAEGEPSPVNWTLEIERFPGYAIIVGNLADKPDAKITVTRPDGAIQVTRSGSKREFGAGGFEAIVTVPGAYTLEFLDQQFTVQMDGQTTAKLHFSTGAEPTAPPTQSAVGGVLKDQFDRAIAGRAVRLDSPASAQTIVTSGDGHFTFENLSAGTYNLSVPDSTISETITLDGREFKAVDLTLRVTTDSDDWQVAVETRPGDIPLMIGDIAQPQQPITVTSPTGIQTVVVSGAKPEYGPGGFEAYVPETGVYSIQFLDRIFNVPMEGKMVYLTFHKRSVVLPQPEPQGRLVSETMSVSKANAILEQMEANLNLKGIFEVEEM